MASDTITIEPSRRQAASFKETINNVVYTSGNNIPTDPSFKSYRDTETYLKGLNDTKIHSMFDNSSVDITYTDLTHPMGGKFNVVQSIKYQDPPLSRSGNPIDRYVIQNYKIKTRL